MSVSLNPIEIPFFFIFQPFSVNRIQLMPVLQGVKLLHFLLILMN